MNPLLISVGRLITGFEDLTPGWMEWAGPTVCAVGQGPPPRIADLVYPDWILVPGLIDVHVHGGGGGSFDSNIEAARVATKWHLHRGTTTMLASLVSAAHTDLVARVEALTAMTAAEEVAGIHLEGPWISQARSGAHDPSVLRPPVAAEIRDVLSAGDGAIRMATLAPELEGGMRAIEQLAELGVICAIGHTDATYAETRSAIDAGARVGTHLFNAMRSFHHREPGPIPALLERGECFVELVADGTHLHPAAIRHGLLGRAQPVLITDATAAAGQPDGTLHIGSTEVSIKDGKACVAGTSTIAGSTLDLIGAVRYAVGSVGMPLFDAVVAATLSPSLLLGRSDIGALAPGRKADAVVLDDRLQVRRVLARGAWI